MPAESYAVYVQRGLAAAARQDTDMVTCKAPDCQYIGTRNGDEVDMFICPLCHLVNCILCDAAHDVGETCADYQLRRNNSVTQRHIVVCIRLFEFFTRYTMIII